MKSAGVLVQPVTGAPGDGQRSLTVALKKRLYAGGVKLANGTAINVYMVKGNVSLSDASGGKQSIRIDWQVLDPARYGPSFGPDDCCGYLVHTPEGTIWHPGDTTLLPEHLEIPGVGVLLLDVSRGDFHLGPDSPCVDAGIDAGVDSDLDGRPRPRGEAPDIGAYESEG